MGRNDRTSGVRDQVSTTGNDSGTLCRTTHCGEDDIIDSQKLDGRGEKSFDSESRSGICARNNLVSRISEVSIVWIRVREW